MRLKFSVPSQEFMGFTRLAVNEFQIYIKTGASFVRSKSIPLRLEENVDGGRFVRVEDNFWHHKLGEALRAFNYRLALPLHLGLYTASVITAKNQLALVLVRILVAGTGSKFHSHRIRRRRSQLDRNLSHFANFGRCDTTCLPGLIAITTLSEAQLSGDLYRTISRGMHGQLWRIGALGDRRVHRLNVSFDIFYRRGKTEQRVNISQIHDGGFLWERLCLVFILPEIKIIKERNRGSTFVESLSLCKMHRIFMGVLFGLSKTTDCRKDVRRVDCLLQYFIGIISLYAKNIIVLFGALALCENIIKSLCLIAGVGLWEDIVHAESGGAVEPVRQRIS